MSRFLLENSETSIYQRINKCIHDSLVQHGHQATLISIRDKPTVESRLQALWHHNPDFILIANSRGSLSEYSRDHRRFLYELVDSEIVFIHHDNCFSDLFSLEEIILAINGLKRSADRSHHFCIEPRNVLDLKALGIPRSYLITHATELVSFQPSLPACNEVSFVGHVLPAGTNVLDEFHWAHYVHQDFWNRVTDLSHCLEGNAVKYADAALSTSKRSTEWVGLKYLYLSAAHLLSQPFRGAIIKAAGLQEINIYGGDPAYLHGSPLDRRINRPNLIYHPPTNTDQQLQNIYITSKININITSLQFDSAVINRVLDAAGSGGFVLTDHRSELDHLTAMAPEISYSSPEELAFKIDYYLHPDHDNERGEIAAALRKEITDRYSYHKLITRILEQLKNPQPACADKVKVDLGCGNWKPDGFLGVDIVSGSNVDIVANLTQEFPFASNTIDYVRAHDIVEHLPDRIYTMNEIWRISRPNAIADIRVPSTDGRGAFQDPTHVSFWNRNSFQYYCVEFPSYIKLCWSYGFQGAFKLLNLDENVANDGVVHVHVRLCAIKIDNLCQAVTQLTEKYPLRLVSILVKPRWECGLATVADQIKRLVRAVNKHPGSASVSLLVSGYGTDAEDAHTAISALMIELILDGSLVAPEAAPAIALLSDSDLFAVEALSSFSLELSGNIEAHTASLLDQSPLLPKF